MVKLENINTAPSVLDTFLGMLLKNNSKGMYFRTRFGIHTFFMKKPIDVLVLNNSHQVVEIKKSLKPNGIFLWSINYNRVVELPEETISKLKIKLGDKISFND